MGKTMRHPARSVTVSEIGNLKYHSIEEIERMARHGIITDAQADVYCEMWNAGPCRFNWAVWRDGAIRLRPRETPDGRPIDREGRLIPQS